MTDDLAEFVRRVQAGTLSADERTAIAQRQAALAAAHPTWSASRCHKRAAWETLNPDWPLPVALRDDAP